MHLKVLFFAKANAAPRLGVPTVITYVLEFPKFDKNCLISKRTSGHLDLGLNARKNPKFLNLGQ